MDVEHIHGINACQSKTDTQRWTFVSKACKTVLPLFTHISKMSTTRQSKMSKLPESKHLHLSALWVV